MRDGAFRSDDGGGFGGEGGPSHDGRRLLHVQGMEMLDFQTMRAELEGLAEKAGWAGRAAALALEQLK